jgi:hypothetical protein
MKKVTVTFAGLMVGALILLGANTLSVASTSPPPAKTEVSKEISVVQGQQIAHYYGCRWVQRCVARDRFGNCLKWKRVWVCPRR